MLSDVQIRKMSDQDLYQEIVSAEFFAKQFNGLKDKEYVVKMRAEKKRRDGNRG